MTNPFEDENGQYMILVNDEAQYSLWPMFRDVPPGWVVAYPKGTRAECLDWVEKHWVDMRPRSLLGTN